MMPLPSTPASPAVPRRRGANPTRSTAPPLRGASIQPDFVRFSFSTASGAMLSWSGTTRGPVSCARMRPSARTTQWMLPSVPSDGVNAERSGEASITPFTTPAGAPSGLRQSRRGTATSTE